MPLAPELLMATTGQPATEAWAAISDHLWQAFSAAIPAAAADSEVVKRDRGLTELDNIISGAAWNIWSDFDSVVPKASQKIVDFWTSTQGGKAVLKRGEQIRNRVKLHSIPHPALEYLLR